MSLIWEGAPAVARAIHERDLCGEYLRDPAKLAEWRRRYGATEEQARLGAFMGWLDWNAEAELARRERYGEGRK